MTGLGGFAAASEGSVDGRQHVRAVREGGGLHLLRRPLAATLLAAASIPALMVAMPSALADSGTVIDNGDIVTVPSQGYPSPWTVGVSLTVGKDGEGTLIITDGGDVTSETGAIGDNAGSSGTVTVTGSDSTWSLGTFFLNVGTSGTGTLTIEDGGKVTSGASSIGNGQGSSGTVTVTGAAWDLQGGVFNVGNFGTGTLTIKDGGSVTSGVGYVGYDADSLGSVTVRGVSTNGTASTWDLQGNPLYVGFFATGTSTQAGGTLSIEAGGLVESGQSSIAYSAGSSGSVTVTGTGSAWNLGTETLSVGQKGTGTLAITDGGSVTSGLGTIGDASNSMGSVTVKGTDADGQASTWNTGTALLYVGGTGTGTLNIEDGGLVKSSIGYIGYNANSTGTVTVTGTAADGTASTWDLGDGELHVGENGAGTLNIEAGGVVTNLGSGYLGYEQNGTGTVTVTGRGSSWDIGRYLYVGYSNSGTLTIAAGGTVTSPGVVIGSRRGVSGTLNLEGTAVSRGTLATGEVDKGKGAAELNLDGGILKATADQEDFLSGFAAGDVQIKSGGAVIDTNGYAIGIGTILQGTGGLGKLGDGTLTLSGTNTYTGGTSIAAGTLQVSSDANLGAVSGGLTFGGGTLETTASFTTSRDVSILTDLSGTFETAGNTTLTLSGKLSGAGKLTKTGDGTLVLSSGNPGFTGATVIDAGTLELDDHASLTASSSVTVNGTLLLPETVDNVALKNLSGTASGAVLSMNPTENKSQVLALTQTEDLAFAGGLSGGQRAILSKSGAGALTLSGDSSAFTGTVNVNDGTLVVSTEGGTTAGTLGGYAIVKSGATLQGGGGTISGGVRVDGGGILSGSQDGGTLTTGTLILNDGAITNVSLATPTTSSAVFTVTGALTVDGTLNVTAEPSYGEGVYRVFSSGEALTDNGLALGTTPDDGFTTTLDVGSNAVDVVVEGSGGGTLQYWSANGASEGGSGAWTSANPWLNTTGSTAAWGGGTGVFTGPAGTVSVTGTQGFGTLEFVTSGYVVEAGANGALDLGSGGRLWAEGAETTATISAPITGTGALTKIGAGTIVLAGTNTYAGGTVLEAGALQVSSDANLGATSGGLTFQGGTLATTASFASARAASLEKDGGTFDTAEATTLTLSGAITGTGALTKDGAGTLVLTGTNTYTGGTTIAAGTLQVGDGGTSGSIVGEVVNNAALVFDRSDTYTFPGTISGNGTVTFLGGGTVLFSDPGAYSGAILVDNSMVHLENGSQTGSIFSLNAGGVLGGNGTIGGLVVNSGGVAAPGNSPGTIVVNGTVTFNDGATYRVDVTPEGEHDLITATGAVTLSNGASVAVVAVPGVYAPETTYAILTTTATVEGTFGSISSDYAFLTPTLSYDAQNVYLTLDYNDVDFGAFARTPNEAGVAAAAQMLGSGNKVYDAILQLPDNAVAGAFDALSGEIYASADTVIQQQSIYVRSAVGARLRQALTAPATQPVSATAAGPATAQLGAGLTPTLWAQGYGGWGNTFGNGNDATLSNTIGGFLIGADVAVADTARAGVFGGYGRSVFNVDARSSSGDMDNYDVGLYAGARFGAFAAKAGLAYSWHDVSVERTVAFPGFLEALNGGYSSNSLQAFGELGYDFTAGAFDFEPFASVAYLTIDGASFRETGGAAALNVNTGSMDTTYTTLGVRMATAVKVYGQALTPSVTLGWQHAFGDTTPTATMLFTGGTAPFQVSGLPIAADTLLVEAGLGYELSDQAALSINYSGQIADAAAQNAFTAQFSLRF